MNYQLVFDVAQSGYRTWPDAAVGLVFVCMGVFLVKNRRNLPAMFPGGLRQKAASVFAYAVLVFSVGWTTVAFTATGREYLKVRDALRKGAAQVVEGRVVDFTPMPYAGHADEHFSVCGV